MNYTTQMDAARKGILTKELLAVAKKEQMEPEKLVKLVAAGQVVIPANKCHTCWIRTESAPHSAQNQRQPRNLPRFKRP